MPSFLLSRISRKGLLYYSLNITLFVFLLIFLIAFLVAFLFSMFLPYYFPFLLSLLWKNSTIKSKIGASVTFLNRSCRNNRIRKGKKKTTQQMKARGNPPHLEHHKKRHIMAQNKLSQVFSETRCLRLTIELRWTEIIPFPCIMINNPLKN